MFLEKKIADTFLFFVYIEEATLQILAKRNKFPLSWNSLKWPLQVEKQWSDQIYPVSCFAENGPPTKLLTKISANQHLKSLLPATPELY